MNLKTGVIAQNEFDRAQQELDRNDVLSALGYLERALCIRDDPHWHSCLGFCIAKQRGHLTRAFELCRTSIEHDPNNPLHYLYLGKVYLLAGNTKEALQTFRQSLVLGGSPELDRVLDEIGTRKSPVIQFLPRSSLLNKYLGIIFDRFGWRK